MPNDIITVSELPDPNCTYIVTCNEVEYECIPIPYTGYSQEHLVCALGNLNLFDSSFPNTREPFVILFYYSENDITLEFNFEDDSIDNTVSIDKVTTSVKPLDTVLSRRIINLTQNPYVLYYFDDNALYTHIDTNLSVADLLNAIVTYGQYMAESVCWAEVLSNKLIGLQAWNNSYLYNPYSGYVTQQFNFDNDLNAYDISSTVEIEDPQYLLDSTLQYEDGDPVICNYIYYNEDDNEVILAAAEPVLKDSARNIIHDFSVGPIIYVMSTGEFIYGDTSWSS